MKLADYMNREDLSRAEMARRLGVSVEIVRQWLVGERRPRQELLVKIYETTAGAVTPNDFYLPDTPEQEGAA